MDLELAHKMEEFRRREPRSYRLFSICNNQWAKRQYTGTGMSCFNNSLRQLHMENRVAAHLKSHGAQYDVAMALSVDYYVATPIRLQHVYEVASANGSSHATRGKPEAPLRATGNLSAQRGQYSFGIVSPASRKFQIDL